MRSVTVTFSDGSKHIFQGVPMEATPEEVLQETTKLFPNRAVVALDGGVKPNKPTLGESFTSGFQNTLDAARVAGASIVGDATQAAKEANARQDARPDSAVNIGDVVDAYKQKGVISAGGELASQVPHAYAEQATNLAASLASARAGAALGGAALAPIGGAPVGAAIGGGIGAFVPSYVQSYGGNLQRQQQEHPNEEVSKTKAALAAIPQALVDTGAMYLGLGKGLIGKLLGPKVAEAVDTAIATGNKAAAEKLVKESVLATAAKGVARYEAFEGGGEVFQQVLERAQAGLPLLDENAFKEYGSTLYQISLMGPTGVAGRFVEKGQTKKHINTDPIEEKNKILDQFDAKVAEEKAAMKQQADLAAAAAAQQQAQQQAAVQQAPQQEQVQQPVQTAPQDQGWVPEPTTVEPPAPAPGSVVQHAAQPVVSETPGEQLTYPPGGLAHPIAEPKYDPALPLEDVLTDQIDPHAAEVAGMQSHFQPFLQRLVENPNFQKWFGTGSMIDKLTGLPRIWFHGTAQNISIFKPKQAGAIFLTPAPSFAEQFAGMSEGWMNNEKNLQAVFGKTKYEAMIRQARKEVFDLRKGSKDPTTGKIIKTLADVDRQTVLASGAWSVLAHKNMPSRANIMPLVTNVQNVWDYQNQADVEALVKAYTDRYVTENADNLRSVLQRGSWSTIEKKKLQDVLKSLGYDGFFVFEGGQKNLGIWDRSKVKSATGNKGTFSKTSMNIGKSLLKQVTKAFDFNKVVEVPDYLWDWKTGEVNVQQLMDWLMTSDAVTSNRPDLAMVAGLVNKFMTKDLKVRVVLDEDLNVAAGIKSKKGLDAAGIYDTGEHIVKLAKAGMTAHTVVHELVHGVTMRILRKYVDTRDQLWLPRNETPPAVLEMYDLYTYVKKNVAVKHYGLQNLSEFVSEGLMNTFFQKTLASLKAPLTVQDNTLLGKLRNALDALLHSIGKVLGADIQQNTVMSEFIKSSAKLMHEQAKSETRLAKIKSALFGPSLVPINNTEALATMNQALDGEVAAAENVASDPNISDEYDVKLDAMGLLADEIDWIPPDPTITEDLKATILSEKDGAALVHGYAGGLQAAEIRKSTLIKTIYRLMDNATKRAKRFEREYIQPLERAWTAMLRNKKNTLLMHQVFVRELKNGKPYTREQLLQVMSQPMLENYENMRDVLELAMYNQNRALVAVGLEPVTAIEAYYAARWKGPYKSIIRDEKGRILWVVAESTRKAAEAARKWVLTKHPDLIAEDVAYFKSRETESMLQAGYQELLKMIDLTDPKAQALHEEWKAAMLGTTENVANQEKHFIRKHGVRGFAGDRPWADPYIDARDFFIEQFKYLKGSANWSAMQHPAMIAKDLLADPAIRQAQPNNVTYAKEYLKNHLGYGTHDAINRLEQAVAEWFGTNTEGAEFALGTMKSLFYITKMGWNLPYTIYAGLQPILGAGKHSLLSSQGYNHNIGRTVVMAVYDGLGFTIYHWLRNFGRWSGVRETPQYQKFLSVVRSGLSKVGQTAADYMEQNGVVDINPMTDIQDLKIPASLHLARQIGGATIQGIEQVSRSMAFFSFVHHLAQSGKLDNNTMNLIADDSTKDVMTDYRPGERALVFQKLGISGKALATLQTFKFNWMSQVWKYAKMAVVERKPGPFLAQMSAYFILGGVMGMVGIDDLEDLWQYILKSDFVDAKTYMQWKDKGPKSFLVRHLPDFLKYGGVSYLTDTNIHTRGSLGDIIPLNPNQGILENLGNLFPFVGDSINDARALVAGGKELFGAGTPHENAAAIYAGLPTVAKGPYEVMSGRFGMGDTASSVVDPTLGRYVRDDKDRATRMLGLKTLKEYETTEAINRHKQMTKELQSRLSTAARQFRATLIEGSPKAMSFLDDYITLGGDPKNLLADARITEAAKRRALDYGSQLALKAKPGNLGAIRNFLDYMQSYQPQRTDDRRAR